ncbi:hypothetical protein [Jiangella asiatica]|uniref:Uncharacterized protein n=1 Tax=Jiangella asiatica TaxID=2530372 RepID=A0A4R5C504_9ACTN|nr:hypothetical protein [Jiangella asiatica]TDD94801.1 hypothetical protein E1269_31665 [Jiangella asiatica]
MVGQPEHDLADPGGAEDRDGLALDPPAERAVQHGGRRQPAEPPLVGQVVLEQPGAVGQRLPFGLGGGGVLGELRGVLEVGVDVAGVVLRRERQPPAHPGDTVLERAPRAARLVVLVLVHLVPGIREQVRDGAVHRAGPVPGGGPGTVVPGDAPEPAARAQADLAVTVEPADQHVDGARR